MTDVDDWDYDLPPEAIARFPVEPRDACRLLHLPLAGGEPVDHVFRDLGEVLRPGDLLVVNDTRVMAARLTARRATGGRIELLVLSPEVEPVPCLARPAKKLSPGDVLTLDGGGEVTVVGPGSAPGQVRVSFGGQVVERMEAQGRVPLPPYLDREAAPEDAEQYQTVYAGPLGSAAAPTAGLHFTDRLLAELADRGIERADVTLHVGIGTFRPLTQDDVDRGTLHEEIYDVPDATVAAIEAARARGGRVIAIGTTSLRTLEAATPPDGPRVPVAGRATTDLFIRPPYTFRCADGLLTNFHLPRSSLLMLVGSFVGRERLLAAYRAALARGYRMTSYGDAMLLV